MNSNRRYYFRVCLAAYVVWIIFFELVGRIAVGLQTHDLTMAVDQWIPVIPEFVWIYTACYLTPLLLIVLVRDEHRINRAILSFFAASFVASFVYLLYPLAFPRPALGDGISNAMLAFTYRIDFQPGANKMPSLHVSMAWILFLAGRKQRDHGYADAGLFALAVAISVSTLFVKQHIFVDVLTGVILAFLVWKGVAHAYVKITEPHLTGPDAMQVALKRIRTGIVVGAVSLSVLLGLAGTGVL